MFILHVNVFYFSPLPSCRVSCNNKRTQSAQFSHNNFDKYVDICIYIYSGVARKIFLLRQKLSTRIQRYGGQRARCALGYGGMYPQVFGGIFAKSIY